jgi:hypothetical protein
MLYGEVSEPQTNPQIQAFLVLREESRSVRVGIKRVEDKLCSGEVDRESTQYDTWRRESIKLWNLLWQMVEKDADKYNILPPQGPRFIIPTAPNGQPFF